MPAGKTHTAVNLIVMFIIIGLLFFTTYMHRKLKEDFETLAIAFVLSYLFSTFLLSPDLDLRKNISKRNWGLLGFIWLPYSWIFKHRGISHSLLLGPLTRILYLAVIVAIAILILKYSFHYKIKIGFDDYDIELIIAILAGLYLPSIVHSLLDRML